MFKSVMIMGTDVCASWGSFFNQSSVDISKPLKYSITVRTCYLAWWLRMFFVVVCFVFLSSRLQLAIQHYCWMHLLFVFYLEHWMLTARTTPCLKYKFQGQIQTCAVQYEVCSMKLNSHSQLWFTFSKPCSTTVMFGLSWLWTRGSITAFFRS